MTHPTRPQHIPWVDGATCGDCIWCHLAQYHIDPRDTGWVCVAPVPKAYQQEPHQLLKIDPNDPQAKACRCYAEMPFQP